MKPHRTYFRPLSARTRQHDPGRTSMSFKASLGAPAVHSDSTPFWYSSASCPHGCCADAAGCEISSTQIYNFGDGLLFLGMMVYYFWGWWFTVDDDFGDGLLLGLPFTKAVFIIKKKVFLAKWKGMERITSLPAMLPGITCSLPVISNKDIWGLPLQNSVTT